MYYNIIQSTLLTAAICFNCEMIIVTPIAEILQKLNVNIKKTILLAGRGTQ